MTKKDNELAHYTLLDAKNAGKGNIICPNCGGEGTREILIDGCDFCGTKFTVKDLSTRVADFCLRQDFNTHYEKYRGRLNRNTNLIKIGVAIFVVLFFLVISVQIFGESASEQGILLTILVDVLVLSFLGAVSYFFIKYLLQPIKAFLEGLAGIIRKSKIKNVNKSILKQVCK